MNPLEEEEESKQVMNEVDAWGLGSRVNKQKTREEQDAGRPAHGGPCRHTILVLRVV